MDEPVANSKGQKVVYENSFYDVWENVIDLHNDRYYKSKIYPIDKLGYQNSQLVVELTPGLIREGKVEKILERLRDFSTRRGDNYKADITLNKDGDKIYITKKN